MLSSHTSQGCSSDASFCRDMVDGGQVPLSQLFQKSSDTWECPSCMITNKNVDTNCACCSCAKPSTGDDASTVSVDVIIVISVKCITTGIGKPA